LAKLAVILSEDFMVFLRPFRWIP